MLFTLKIIKGKKKVLYIYNDILIKFRYNHNHFFACKCKRLTDLHLLAERKVFTMIKLLTNYVKIDF